MKKNVFLLDISNKHIEYFKQKFLFYKKSFKEEIDVLIITHNDLNDYYKHNMFISWCKKVYVINHKNENWKNLAKSNIFPEFKNCKYILSLDFEAHPHIKWLSESISKHFKNIVFLKLEDGLRDYCQDLYPHATICENIKIPKENLLFCLFYPKLVNCPRTIQVNILDYFDFNKTKKNVIKDSCVIVPINMFDLHNLYLFAKKNLKSKKIYCSLHPRTYHFHREKVLYSKIINLPKDLLKFHKNIGICPANNISERFVNYLVKKFPDCKATIYDKNTSKKYFCKINNYENINKNLDAFYVFSPNYCNEIINTLKKKNIKKDKIYNISNEDVDLLDKRDMYLMYGEKKGQFINIDFHGETPSKLFETEIFEKYKDIIYFSPIEPLELMNLQNCTVLSYISSVLYRVTKLHSSRAISLMPKNGFSCNAFNSRKLYFDQKKVETIANKFKKLNVEVVWF